MRSRALSVEEQVLALAQKRGMQAAGGLEVCAAETGLSTSHLSRCGSSTHPDSLTLHHVLTIDALAGGQRGGPFILNALARLLGKVVLDGPGVVDTAESIQASVLELMKELGDFARSVSLAVEDGKWTRREVDAAMIELDQHDAVSAATRCKLLQLKRQMEAE